MAWRLENQEHSRGLSQPACSELRSLVVVVVVVVAAVVVVVLLWLLLLL